MPELTEEQQAIVDHSHGPALVFAVAGAGKTTAMVNRIERLVRERVFTPRSILATSFSRAAVGDIRLALRPWPHCASVKVATLHSAGSSILTLARRSGHLTELKLMEDESGNAGALVLSRTLARARREQVSYKADLETLDRLHDPCLDAADAGNRAGKMHMPTNHNSIRPHRRKTISCP